MSLGCPETSTYHIFLYSYTRSLKNNLYRTQGSCSHISSRTEVWRHWLHMHVFLLRGEIKTSHAKAYPLKFRVAPRFTKVRNYPSWKKLKRLGLEEIMADQLFFFFLKCVYCFVPLKHSLPRTLYIRSHILVADWACICYNISHMEISDPLLLLAFHQNLSLEVEL